MLFRQKYKQNDIGTYSTPKEIKRIIGIAFFVILRFFIPMC